MTSLSYRSFLSILGHYIESLNKVRPYRETSIFNHDRISDFTKVEWDSYQWNPPVGYDSPDLRSNVLQVKPTWAQLLGYMLDQTRKEKIPYLREVCMGLISKKAYRARNEDHEIHKRRSIRDTSRPAPINEGRDMDNEKKAYEKRYHFIKNYIATTADSESLESFDPTADSNWLLGSPWRRPDGVATSLAAEDTDQFTLNEHDISVEEHIRMDEIREPHLFNNKMAKVLDTILESGSERGTWRELEIGQYDSWKLDADKMNTIAQKADILKSMDVIPADYQDDSYWTNTPVRSVPTFGSAEVANQSYSVGQAITPLVLPVATGGEGELVYKVASLPVGLSFDPTTRTITGTPTDVVNIAVTYSAVDSVSGVSLAFSIRIG